jgi:hypothetical protein
MEGAHLDTPQKDGLFPHISNDKLNVFSEGLFLTNEKHERLIVLPEKVHAYFKNDVDSMQFLVVLRSQQTLVFSNYVQTFGKIKEKTFGEYLDARLANPRRGNFKIFYFHDLIRKYAELVGKENMHIIFFEDIIHDMKRFCSDLGRALNISDEVVMSLLSESYFNKTPQTGAASIAEKGDRFSLRGKLMSVLKRMGLLPGGLETTIPPITDDEKMLIFNAFKASNLELAEYYCLDRKRMREYGYL